MEHPESHTTPDAGIVYDPPVVLAAFPKAELTRSLPENITSHLHAVQDS